MNIIYSSLHRVLEEEQIDEETVKEDIPQGDATRRFAVMGCDWDHVSAGDLLVLHGLYFCQVILSDVLCKFYILTELKLCFLFTHLDVHFCTIDREALTTLPKGPKLVCLPNNFLTSFISSERNIVGSPGDVSHISAKSEKGSPIRKCSWEAMKNAASHVLSHRYNFRPAGHPICGTASSCYGGDCDWGSRFEGFLLFLGLLLLLLWSWL